MRPVVNTKDPAAVEAEVQATHLALFPYADKAFVSKAFFWFVNSFSGKYRDYSPIDARYHDLEHTLQVTLCMMRLLHGRHLAKGQPELPHRLFKLGLLAILLHDTGYLKTRDDTDGTGAKYTLVHVNRSIEFAAGLLAENGYPHNDILAVQNMIRCTGVNVKLDAIPFQEGAERIAGYALGTADLLGQMAAKDYVEKLPILFEEFQESDRFNANNTAPRMIFASALDLIEKTPGFWKHYVMPRITNDFQGLYKFLNKPFPDGPNFYIDRIEANIDRVQKLIAAPAS
ncbi:MAG: hypothetical protein O2960_14910 [Verrucomicrobia bacterium]|nr:hypothetical protein [Verrucomicrobiota bacterium]